MPSNSKTLNSLPKIFPQNTSHITLGKSRDKHIRIDASAAGDYRMTAVAEVCAMGSMSIKL